jgi:ATP-dependent DNA helicase DinG
MGAPTSGARFDARAAADLRRAIREAGGVEVFAIGDVEGGVVTALTVTCRGQEDRVLALVDRPRPGQVVIHNHPSGVLRPSDADMALAGRYGDDGVGFVIVDSDVSKANWVVEPHQKKVVPLDPDDVEAFFRERLPAALPGFEARPGQLTMARGVARALSDNTPYVVEAGTGTGKSLAYLVPAAMWALRNPESKVVVSTYTKALQAQILGADAPILGRIGLDVRVAALLGRNNYVCKRRLGLASQDPDSPEAGEIAALVEWDRSGATGTRQEMGTPVSPAAWERIESDGDLTMRTRCPHYDACHYYVARRTAAAAHLLVVNHALLLADRSIRDGGGPGVLPKYDRVVFDEAHHLEASATSATTSRLAWPAVQRAVFPLLGTARRQGALARILKDHATIGGSVPPDQHGDLHRAVERAIDTTSAVKSELPSILEDLAGLVLDVEGNPRRIRREDVTEPLWTDVVGPRVERCATLLDEAVAALADVLDLFDDRPLPTSRAEGVLDARRAARRLGEKAEATRAFLSDDEAFCRFVSLVRSRGELTAGLERAPVDVAQALRKILWDPVPGAVSTSATLTVGGRFEHWLVRTGLFEPATDVVPSPFDYPRQALLALPRDLPDPNDPAFLETTGRVTVDAVRESEGGAFVLCTSYAAVRWYQRQLREALPASWPVLAQDATGRTSLLAEFRAHPNAVLVGTDSFWEGVDVRGDRLRLVVIPRLPFRVPSDPLQEARHERIAARGGDPFRSFTLPSTILKLRQGFGRLIRSTSDRGVVMLLDRRLHDKPYGRVVLHALPPARRVTGPWSTVRQALRAFYADRRD